MLSSKVSIILAMKVCRTCGKTFGDEMMFCLEDGTNLSGDVSQNPSEEQTLIKPAATAGGSNTAIFAISGFMLITFLLITLGAGGLIYYSTRPETARTNTNAEETPASAEPTPESVDQYYPTPSPEPTTEKTPEKPVTETPSKTPTPKPADIDEPKSPPAKPGQISGGVLNGKATSLPQPIYPPAARRAGISGRVVVQILVGKAGDVILASAFSGPALLRPAAVRAARRAKFPPTIRAGQAVTVSGMLVYNFKL